MVSELQSKEVRIPKSSISSNSNVNGGGLTSQPPPLSFANSSNISISTAKMSLSRKSIGGKNKNVTNGKQSSSSVHTHLNSTVIVTEPTSTYTFSTSTPAPSPPLPSSPATSSGNAQSPPNFDFTAPCQYFKSSFARNLSLASCHSNQTRSLDFGINFSLPMCNSPIKEEATLISPLTPVASYDDGTTGNEKIDDNIGIPINTSKSCKEFENRRHSLISPRIDNIFETESLPSPSLPLSLPYNKPSPNKTLQNGNIRRSLWSNSQKHQSFHRRSLDSTECEVLRLRKECQSLVEENRRLMGLASGIIGGNYVVPADSPNIEAVYLQTQVDTLQWQLKQVEVSRQMYRAVMEEVVRFLERCHRNLDFMQKQQLQSEQQICCRSRCFHHNINQNDSTVNNVSSNLSSINNGNGNNIPGVNINVNNNSVVINNNHRNGNNHNNNISNNTSLICSSRVRTSTNIMENINSKFSNLNTNSSTVSSASSASSTSSSIASSISSKVNEDSSNNSPAASYNNLTYFTWRKSPKRSTSNQLATTECDPEKLNQDAYRLLRTAQNLLNTQEPNLAEPKQPITGWTESLCI